MTSERQSTTIKGQTKQPLSERKKLLDFCKLIGYTEMKDKQMTTQVLDVPPNETAALRIIAALTSVPMNTAFRMGTDTFKWGTTTLMSTSDKGTLVQQSIFWIECVIDMSKSNDGYDIVANGETINEMVCDLMRLWEWCDK